MVEHIINSISHLYPEIAITLTLCVALIADLVLKKESHAIGWIVLGGLVITGVLVVAQTGRELSIFSDMLAVDPFAVFFKIMLLIASVLVVLFSMQSRELIDYVDRIGEYYMLILGMILGMFLMVGATNVLLMYLAFELTSICSYVLAGFTRRSLKSAEASMKYIVYGAVSSGIMLYGISLLVGITGAVSIYGINEALAAGVEQPLVLLVAGLMILVGLGFKIAIVPFHFWAPDVYEGAPITITAYLAVASKIAAFAMTVRFFKVAFLDNGVDIAGALPLVDAFNWSVILAVMAALAMIVGNLVALWQQNIKRLLAYSSIAHAGYILMGLVVLTDEGVSAIMIYVFIYLFMNMGAFYVAMLVSNKLGTEQIDDYKGLGRRAPLESVAMTVFLVALTGLPPTAGFIAKLFIFGAAINAGWLLLVLIAGIMTIVSLFYYMRVVRNMFLFEPQEEAGLLNFGLSSKIILMVMLVPTLIFGVYFTPVLEFARNSIQIFGL